ncbi:hypothetical protein ACEWY4_006209 [Coilia grayii]|uniref:Immunoglobulin V-set domain-containing protein n=1 Tax=Coilia grayii TaxID=363190 RepID=A0ABD1KCW5_9TELE
MKAQLCGFTGLLAILSLTLKTVSSVNLDVLEGRPVTLTTLQHENRSTIRDMKWFYNKSVTVVWYLPKHNEVDVHKDYLNKVKFSIEDFSLTLKNPQTNDSGVYKAVIDIKDASSKPAAEYELSVLEHAASPILTVVSKRPSSDSCNVTLRCTGPHESLNFSCYRSLNSTSCSPEGGGSFLSFSVNHTTVSCNQSNPVSWRQTTIELKPLCMYEDKTFEIPLRTPWWVYLLTSIILGIAVFAAVVASLFVKKSRNRGGAQNQGNDQTAQVNSPPTEMGPVSRSAGGADNAYDTPGTQAQNGPPPRTIYDTVQSSRMQAPPSPEQTLLQEPMYTEAETVYAKVNKPKKGGPD